jgi:hypothetical protein
MSRHKSRTFSTEIPDSLDIVPMASSVRSKAGKKAKRKGSSYERTLCKTFSELWGSKFFRTPMSGGSQLKHDYNLAGDISTPDETFPYHVEAKNQEALQSFHNIFTSAKCPVWKWWTQCTTECPSGKVPLLVFTKNYMPSFVMAPGVYMTIVEAMSRTELGYGDVHNSFSELLRVRDCAIMTLDRFVRFNKSIHSASSEEYLLWGTQHETTFDIFEGPPRTIVCKTVG